MEAEAWRLRHGCYWWKGKLLKRELVIGIKLSDRGGPVVSILEGVTRLSLFFVVGWNFGGQALQVLLQPLHSLSLHAKVILLALVSELQVVIFPYKVLVLNR